MKRIDISRGDSKLFFVLSSVNGALYALWTVIYVVCLVLRSSAFNSAQTSMMMGGYTDYTVEVTSPFFGILKAIAFILPVMMAVWTGLLFVNERKGRRLCDSKLLVGVFAADALCAILCALDITTLHMIF